MKRLAARLGESDLAHCSHLVRLLMRSTLGLGTDSFGIAEADLETPFSFTRKTNRSVGSRRQGSAPGPEVDEQPSKRGAHHQSCMPCLKSCSVCGVMLVPT